MRLWRSRYIRHDAPHGREPTSAESRRSQPKGAKRSEVSLRKSRMLFSFLALPSRSTGRDDLHRWTAVETLDYPPIDMSIPKPPGPPPGPPPRPKPPPPPGRFTDRTRSRGRFIGARPRCTPHAIYSKIEKRAGRVHQARLESLGSKNGSDRTARPGWIIQLGPHIGSANKEEHHDTLPSTDYEAGNEHRC